MLCNMHDIPFHTVFYIVLTPPSAHLTSVVRNGPNRGYSFSGSQECSISHLQGDHLVVGQDFLALWAQWTRISKNCKKSSKDIYLSSKKYYNDFFVRQKSEKLELLKVKTITLIKTQLSSSQKDLCSFCF